MDIQDMPLIVFVLPQAAAIGLLIYGFIKATRPDPSRIDRVSPFSARCLARGTWVVALGLFLVLMFVFLLREGWGLELDFVQQAMEWCSWTMMLCLLAGAFFLLRHAATLAARLPRKMLAAAIYFAMVILALLVGLTLLVTNEWIWDWLEQMPFFRSRFLLRYIMEDCILYMLLPGQMLLLIVISIWYWWALSRAAKFAWTTWAKRNHD
ncbi:MAG: hypothetical protein IT445_07030 [Phycisphaeraceae bacterium]|nr:hypothetical protein [Phycisphaeraceae bacterium]